MNKCTQQQLNELLYLEQRDGVTHDPELEMGCTAEQPYGNSAYAEDNLKTPGPNGPTATPYVSPDYEPEWGDLGTLGGYLTPGLATTGSLDAIGGWIENGFDGEKDGEWSQAARAVPGAVAMGGAMAFGRAADAVINTGGLIGRGIHYFSD